MLGNNYHKLYSNSNDFIYFKLKEKLNVNSWRLIGAAAETQDKCVCLPGPFRDRRRTALSASHSGANCHRISKHHRKLGMEETKHSRRRGADLLG